MRRAPAKKQMGVALGDALKAELEVGATAHGHSVASEIRRRLDEGYEYDTAEKPTRALADMILHLATLVRLQTGQDWHSHPAANRVMRYAITAHLARLKPPGDAAFKANELPSARLVTPGTDDPESMGLALEHVAFSYPLKKTTAEERQASFEKTKSEIRKKGSSK